MINAFMNIKPILQHPESRGFINPKENVYTTTPYQELEFVTN
jgi:hypothetical protein